MNKFRKARFFHVLVNFARASISSSYSPSTALLLSFSEIRFAKWLFARSRTEFRHFRCRGELYSRERAHACAKRDDNSSLRVHRARKSHHGPIEMKQKATYTHARSRYLYSKLAVNCNSHLRAPLRLFFARWRVARGTVAKKLKQTVILTAPFFLALAVKRHDLSSKT